MSSSEILFFVSTSVAIKLKKDQSNKTLTGKNNKHRAELTNASNVYPSDQV
jgi:hypothetical protein